MTDVTDDDRFIPGSITAKTLACLDKLEAGWARQAAATAEDDCNDMNPAQPKRSRNLRTRNPE